MWNEKYNNLNNWMWYIFYEENNIWVIEKYINWKLYLSKEINTTEFNTDWIKNIAITNNTILLIKDDISILIEDNDFIILENNNNLEKIFKGINNSTNLFLDIDNNILYIQNDFYLDAPWQYINLQSLQDAWYTSEIKNSNIETLIWKNIFHFSNKSNELFLSFPNTENIVMFSNMNVINKWIVKNIKEWLYDIISKRLKINYDEYKEYEITESKITKDWMFTCVIENNNNDIHLYMYNMYTWEYGSYGINNNEYIFDSVFYKWECIYNIKNYVYDRYKPNERFILNVDTVFFVDDSNLIFQDNSGKNNYCLKLEIWWKTFYYNNESEKKEQIFNYLEEKANNKYVSENLRNSLKELLKKINKSKDNIEFNFHSNWNIIFIENNIEWTISIINFEKIDEDTGYWVRTEINTYIYIDAIHFNSNIASEYSDLKYITSQYNSNILVFDNDNKLLCIISEDTKQQTIYFDGWNALMKMQIDLNNLFSKHISSINVSWTIIKTLNNDTFIVLTYYNNEYKNEIILINVKEYDDWTNYVKKQLTTTELIELWFIPENYYDQYKNSYNHYLYNFIRVSKNASKLKVLWKKKIEYLWLSSDFPIYENIENIFLWYSKELPDYNIFYKSILDNEINFTNNMLKYLGIEVSSQESLWLEVRNNTVYKSFLD